MSDRDDLINLIDARTFRGVNGPVIHALADEIIAAGWINSNRLLELAQSEAESCEDASVGHEIITMCSRCGIEAHEL
jgi:hypothetical protein